MAQRTSAPSTKPPDIPVVGHGSYLGAHFMYLTIHMIKVYLFVPGMHSGERCHSSTGNAPINSLPILTSASRNVAFKQSDHQSFSSGHY